jgi:hypothetical protein
MGEAQQSMGTAMYGKAWATRIAARRWPSTAIRCNAGAVLRTALLRRCNTQHWQGEAVQHTALARQSLATRRDGGSRSTG